MAKGGMRSDECGDIGIYSFRYGLYPYTGGYSADNCVRPAYLFNYPLLPSKCILDSALITIDATNIVVETVKLYEVSAMAFIVRLCESEGTDSRAEMILRDSS